MGVRPFDWRDLNQLHRYRHQSIFLCSSLLLTRGPLLVPGALVSFLAPSVGLITAAVEGNKKNGGSCLYGQTIQVNGAAYANLTFFTPEEALDSDLLPPMLDYLAVQAGERGAFRILADVDEHSPVYESLRSASFAIYARQRIWKLHPPSTSGDPEPQGWRKATNRDGLAIRALFNNMVPGLVQQIEPISTENPRGMLYYDKGELLAYVELKYGPRGVWANPLVHTDAEDVTPRLLDLFRNLPHQTSRQVYICVRSYQSWLESTLEELGATVGPRQAVMVKHLAVNQKAGRLFSIPTLEGGQADLSAPMARVKHN
ncbi:MAG TPA: hypothetical protein VN363_06065 [Anaerolineales bacterium]|nr:hypothetical protein [Anaerolineales bacterium]